MSFQPPAAGDSYGPSSDDSRGVFSAAPPAASAAEQYPTVDGPDSHLVAGEPTSPRTPLIKRTQFIAPLAALLAFVIGFAIGASGKGGVSAADYEALQADLGNVQSIATQWADKYDEAEEVLAQWETAYADEQSKSAEWEKKYNDAVGDLPNMQAELDQQAIDQAAAQEALDARQVELDALAAELDARKVNIEENTIPGNGVFLVGEQVQPGTYQTEGPGSSSFCYWARLSDVTGTFGDLIANDNVSGPTVVRILPTDVAFESSRCMEWIKID